jgi:hypothetical protein
MAPVERTQEPPELEYNAVRNDSLTMFGAAIGGAILGMMLTLLVLAIINGGTLSFTGGERYEVLAAHVTRLDENVGAVGYNVGVVAEQARAIQGELAALETSLRAEMASGDAEMAELTTAVEELSVTSDQFTTFLVALSDAISRANEAIQGAEAGD